MKLGHLITNIYEEEEEKEKEGLENILAKTMEGVKRPADLNQDVMEDILKAFFQTPAVDVTLVGSLEQVENDHDFLNSDVRKLEVKARIRAEEKTLSMVIKRSLDDSAFHRKLSKLARMFTVETFLYTKAFPALATQVPEVGDMVAKCYFAYSSSQRDFERPGCWERHCWKPLAIVNRKPEKGFLLLEDISKIRVGSEAYKILDKTAVPGVAHVKVAFQGNSEIMGGIWLETEWVVY